MKVPRIFTPLTLFTLALLSAAPLAQATLKFEETLIEHTATAEEVDFTAIYKFTNTGSEAIKINKVTTTCGCTTAKLEKKEFAPGESGQIPVTFKYEDRKDFQMKSIGVETTGGTYQLTLEVMIPAFVEINPPMHTWDKGGEPEPRVFTIKVEAGTPFEVVEVELDNAKKFSGTLVETTKDPKKGRQYTYTVTPGSTEKYEKSVIRVKTNFPKDKPRVFKTFCMVKP